MASETQPKADQPRVTTENLKRGNSPTTLEYRVTNIKTAPRDKTRGARSNTRSM
jgi:hypothetical protein